jgi:cyclophilin family peptidyl-prolyl cis-trans isomerase
LHHYDVRLVTRADKRARQKERTRQAKEARDAALRRERRKSMAIRVGISLAIVAALIGITSWLRRDDNKSASPASTTTTTPKSLPAGCSTTKPPANPNRPKSFPNPPPMSIDTAKTYTAKLTTSCGDITIMLDDNSAPTSVNNFVFLAKQGFYDGLEWPRAAKDFVIQTGSPENTTAGAPGYSIAAELPKNGAYASGAVAWAKGGSEPAGTAGSQFFIVTGTGSGLTPDYGYIGMVTGGLDNAQKIASLAPDSGDGPPTIPMYLDKVEIVES